MTLDFRVEGYSSDGGLGARVNILVEVRADKMFSPQKVRREYRKNLKEGRRKPLNINLRLNTSKYRTVLYLYGGFAI